MMVGTAASRLILVAVARTRALLGWSAANDLFVRGSEASEDHAHALLDHRLVSAIT